MHHRSRAAAALAAVSLPARSSNSSIGNNSSSGACHRTCEVRAAAASATMDGPRQEAPTRAGPDRACVLGVGRKCTAPAAGSTREDSSAACTAAACPAAWQACPTVAAAAAALRWAAGRA
jgi:hypothetical protein